MCEAPLALNASVISTGRADLSPVSRAVIKAEVPLSEKGTEATASLTLSHKNAEVLAMADGACIELTDVLDAAARHVMPAMKAAAPIVRPVISLFFRPAFPIISRMVSSMAAADADSPMHNVNDAGIRLAARVPAANGNANPAMSLPSVISLRIFAKVAIILLTLRGLTIKSEIKIQNHDNLST